MAIAWIAFAAYLWCFSRTTLLRFLELDGFFSDCPARLVLAFSLLLSAYPIWWGLSVGGYWAMDEISAGTVRYGMSVGYASGCTNKYPPFHYYVINLFLLPFFAADRLGLVSILDTTAYAVESGVVRALSLAMGIGSVALVYVCGAITFGSGRELLAALVWTMALPFVYHGKLGTLDVPYTFWFALSLLFYIRIVQRGARRDYVLFATAAVLAVCTKDQAYGMYALPALHILIVTVRQHATPSPAAVLRRNLRPTPPGCRRVGCRAVRHRAQPGLQPRWFSEARGNHHRGRERGLSRLRFRPRRPVVTLPGRCGTDGILSELAGRTRVDCRHTAGAWC